VRHGQGERPIASKFAAHDYAAIARAMGCIGLRVTDPSQLAPALAKALSADRPVVVDVVTSGQLTFRDVTADLSRVAQGVV
jgi:acetolactate synthase-1/2/3 large subunit